jgi:hypothetical protein
MESRAEDNFSWLFGLRSYYMFLNDKPKLELIRSLISLKYGKKEDGHHILKRICLTDIEQHTSKYQTDNRENRFNYYFDLLNDANSLDIHKVLNLINLLEPDPLCNSLENLISTYGASQSVVDAFSKGQVTSKVWLTETLQKLINPNIVLDNIVLVGGWYGHLSHYLKNRISYNKIYNIDPHEFNTCVGHEFFNMSSPDFIPSSTTIENIDVTLEGFKIPTGYYDKSNDFHFNVTGSQTVMPDLVINTSCEHISDGWYNKVPVGKMIAIQTNNLFNIAPDHFNCIEKQSDMDHKYPMSKVLFQGELDITMGKRFMKIGIR